MENKKKILIVENDFLTSVNMKMAFQTTDYDLFWCKDVLRAVNLAHSLISTEKKFDLLIADLESSGYPYFNNTNEDEKDFFSSICKIPFFFLTSNNKSLHNLHKSSRNNFCGYISKSDPGNDLREKVSSFFENSH